jgi:cholesterol transport system auxiliary component
MIRTRLQVLACSTLLASSFLLSGCGQGAVANRKYFMLEATRQGPPASFHSKATLQVRQFYVDQAFATRQLVYRVDTSRYEPDFYNQFLIPPGSMITERTRDWLTDSDLFQRVSSATSALESTYALEGNVIALYADFRQKSAPEAVMAIRFYLLATPDANESVVLTKTFWAVAPIAANTADAVVGAMSKSLADILSRLEADIEKMLIQRKKQDGKKPV